MQQENQNNPPKTVRKKNQAASLRALKAVNILAVNGGNKRQALRDAGYSEAVAKNPRKVFESKSIKPIINRVIPPVVTKMEKIRDAILDGFLERESKIKKIGWFNGSFVMKNLNHDIQLLSGMPTENTHEISEEEMKEVSEILKNNFQA